MATTKTNVVDELVEIISEMMDFADEQGKQDRENTMGWIESLGRIGNEIRDHYIYLDTEGDVPTVAQGVALARFLRPEFQLAEKGLRGAHVFRGGLSLPEDYIGIRCNSGYEGGIDKDGRTST